MQRATIHLVLVLLALAMNLLAQAGPADPVRVLIGFRQLPGPAEIALVRAAGGTPIHTYWLVPSIAARVPQAAVQGLRNNPLVTHVDIDAIVQEVDQELDNTWGVKRIGSGVVHGNGNLGTGVKVCVIDSGIDYTHSEFAGRYMGGYNFVAGTSDPFDDRGHGTHVSGTVLAARNSAGVVGVAPEAQLLAYKILDQNGQGYVSDAIAALQSCIQAGGQVTNSSFGTSSDPGSDIRQAYDNAELAGLVNVAAAGNQSSFFRTCNAISFPARYSSVIAVTATDTSNAIASFSCRGPEAELAAPGVNINSTVPTGSCANCASSGYRTLSGTSMASPHVAGVAALVIAAGIADTNSNGRISDEVRARLQSTATDLGAAGRDSLYGYGLVNAELAAPSAPPAPPAAPTGLSASAASSSEIDLVWNDNSGNETGFKIERCTGAGCANFAEIATVGAGATSYRNSGLSASTAYSYIVRAFNSGGTSEAAGPASATTLAEPLPSAPASLAASPVSSSQINLSWTNDSSNATGIEIERCMGPNCAVFAKIADVSGTATSYSDQGLSANTAYTYRVRAYNAGGASGYSNSASATTLAAGSIQLSATGYKVQGLQKADLSWSGATSASVEVKRNGAVIATVTNTGAYTDHINRRGSGTYTYQVCEAGTSACSNQVTVTF